MFIPCNCGNGHGILYDCVYMLCARDIFIVDYDFYLRKLARRTKLLEREGDRKNATPRIIREWKEFKSIHETPSDNGFEYFMFNVFPLLYFVFTIAMMVCSIVFYFKEML